MKNCVERIRLSYVVTTFNKLKYLKITLPLLLLSLKNDEEVIIIDGGSTDGTREYLSSLYDDGKIHQFLSEKDSGEAHGFNKSILLSNGDFIKPISDDDLFEYDNIRKCVDFMISNDDVDLMGTGGISYNYNEDNFESSVLIDKDLFQRYISSRRPFFISGLGVILRKSSISKTGLYCVNYKRVDMEFWLRSSSNQTLKIAYAPVNTYCWIANINSN